MEKNWYVLQVYSGHEYRVKGNLEKMVVQHNLQDKITQVKVPTMEVAQMKNGKRRISKKKIMPGYVLVEMEMTDDLQFKVKSIPSVATFVGKKSQPEPLTLEEIKNIFSEMGDIKSEEPSKPRLIYSVGETLKIIDGPFANFSGIVDEIFPDKGRLRLRVEIFGRSTPVELDFLQVGKA
ncbi:MAG: transcription termination/antitermination factor NusG [Leptospiraceae bacterium]|nr:transcription termination/antitermination factor NusG [Leptospiraceae bacterium]MCP5495899.1 transcription termination/antitermination factor NusG [Leptospiraceae bacterium]